MTIRARLTFWYAGTLFISALVIGGVAYNEFVIERRGEAVEPDPTESVISDLVEIGVWFGLPAAILGLGGGWFLMRKALSPVAALTGVASRITEHNLSEPLPRSGNGDELDRLTDVLNAMTARLDGSFQHIREFTLHASHELKTPLTVLHGELEQALQDSDLPEAHRQRCETQLSEVQRLAQIVDGLTLLTKADAGQVPLAQQPVRLDELVRDAFEDARILAQPRHVRVDLGSCEPLTVVGDRNRLRQLLLNLTDNAVKYNRDNGRLTFSLRCVDRLAELTIANTGPGVPVEAQARLFDRFFRGDPSHNHDEEGCGLGLSIAQWVVVAHQGTITITSQPGEQTIVTVRLPMETR